MREKLGEVREKLVEFNLWVDRELFGEQPGESVQAAQGKFYHNHHLLLTKDCLTAELAQLLEVAKEGILQLREMSRGNLTPVRRREEVPALRGELSFKKKTSFQGEVKTERVAKKETPVVKDNKASKATTNKKMGAPCNSENQTPRSSHELPYKDSKTDLNSKHLRHHKPSITNSKKPTKNLPSKASLQSTPKLPPQVENDTLEVPF